MFLRSFKQFTVNLLVESLRKVNSLNYEHFINIDTAYTGFFNKVNEGY